MHGEGRERDGRWMERRENFSVVVALEEEGGGGGGGGSKNVNLTF